MLKRVDRILVAVPDSASAERTVAEVFGAELVRRDTAPPIRAKRSTMQAGTSLIELLEPDGTGPVQDFVSKWESGLFGVGFSVHDTNAAAHQLKKSDCAFRAIRGATLSRSRCDLGDAH